MILLLILFAFLVASGARRMGYSGLLWFFVSFLGVPLLAMVGLCSLPDKAVNKFRQNEVARLQAFSARASGQSSSSAVTELTVNNERTQQ
jgi:hypothetical protein